MMYMLVIPPVGDIEQVEYSGDSVKAFDQMKVAASTTGRPAHLEQVKYLAIPDLEMFVDEDARMRAVEIPLNERASWLARRNIVGPAVVVGADDSEDIPGLTLDRALAVRKQLDGAL